MDDTTDNIWDLFEQDGQQNQFESSSSAAADSASSSGHRLQAPPPSRSPTNLVGLENLGTTCYLNSLIQTLFFTPSFVQKLFAIAPAELGAKVTADGRMEDESRARRIPWELQKLFARMVAADRLALSLSDLTKSFGWARSQEIQQHDVQELNRVLFQAIEQSLRGTHYSSLIPDLYGGTLANIIQCLQCGTTKRREEGFQDLSIPVSGVPSLQDGLAKFVEMEHLTGSNKYACDVCGDYCDAYKGVFLHHLPPIMTLCLLRFSYDWERNRRVKETSKFSFPTSINLRAYCTEDSGASEEDYDYELYSVVIHSGAAHGGHYHAFVRDTHNLGAWEKPAPSSKPAVEVDYLEQDDPWNLLHAILLELEGKMPDKPIPIADICGRLASKTGTSWNKRFKRQYGTIRKFLSENPAIFMLEGENAALTPHARDLPIGSARSSGKRASSSSKKKSKGPQPARASAPAGADDDEPQSQGPDQVQTSQAADEARWFDMNDSRSKSISSSTIQSMFSGSESAYMLFYARRGVLQAWQRQAATQGGIELPPFHKQQVEHENSELQTARSEYDRLSNEVSVSIFTAQDLLPSSDGGLHVANDPLKLSCDQRDPWQPAVLSAIMQRGSDASTWTTLSLVKTLDNNVVHVFEPVASLTSADEDQSWQKAGIRTNMTLVAWDSKTVGGQPYAAGDLNCPVFISVIHLSTRHPQGQSYRVSVSKGTTLASLRRRISDLVGLSAKYVLIHRVDQPNKRTGEIMFFDNNMDGATLDELDLVGEAVELAVEQAGRGDLPLARKMFETKQRYVSVRARADWPSRASELKEIEVDTQSALLSLKQELLALFQLDCNEVQAVLRCFNQEEAVRGNQPAQGMLVVDETKPVSSLDMHGETILTISPGTLPTKGTELVVRVALGPKAAKENGEQGTFKEQREFYILRKAAVADLLRHACQALELKGESWHLCRTNWCGEPGEVLNDYKATLADTKLMQNELLLVEPGRVAAKGFSTIHLFLNLELASHLSQSEQNEILELCAQPRPGDSGRGNDDQGDEKIEDATDCRAYADSVAQAGQLTRDPLHKLGNIQMSHDTTFSELMRRIHEMPVATRCSEVAATSILLRNITNGRMGRLIHDSSPEQKTSLKKLKIHNNSCLALCPCTDEIAARQLNAGSIILNACKRLVDIGEVSCPVKLVFDAGLHPTLLDLKRRLSLVFDIPVEHMTVAKHNNAKGSWRIVEDGKAKRHGKKTLSVRNPPTGLRDGDLVVARDDRQDPEMKDDFSTSYDRELQAMLNQAAEQKRQARAANKRLHADWYAEQGITNARPLEVGITIDVPSYEDWEDDSQADSSTT